MVFQNFAKQGGLLSTRWIAGTIIGVVFTPCLVALFNRQNPSMFISEAFRALGGYKQACSSEFVQMSHRVPSSGAFRNQGKLYLLDLTKRCARALTSCQLEMNATRIARAAVTGIGVYIFNKIDNIWMDSCLRGPSQKRNGICGHFLEFFPKGGGVFPIPKTFVLKNVPLDTLTLFKTHPHFFFG